MGYGVGASLASVGRARGGLAGLGQSREQQAMQLLGDAAAQETQRNITNEQMTTQRKAGNASLGASIGAMAGSAIFPGVGTLVGGVLGGLAGNLF